MLRTKFADPFKTATITFHKKKKKEDKVKIVAIKKIIKGFYKADISHKRDPWQRLLFDYMSSKFGLFTVLTPTQWEAVYYYRHEHLEK